MNYYIYKCKYNNSTGYKYYFDNYYFDNYDYKLEIPSVNYDNYKFNYECTINYGTLNRNGNLSMNGVNRFGSKFHQNYNIKYKYELIIDKNKNKIIKKYILDTEINKYNSLKKYNSYKFIKLLNFYYTCYKLKDQENYKTIIETIIKIKGVLSESEISGLLFNIKSNTIRIPESKEKNKHNLIEKVKKNLLKNSKKMKSLIIGNTNLNKYQPTEKQTLGNKFLKYIGINKKQE